MFLKKSFFFCLQETSANNMLDNGLVQGHAYTITGVKQIMSRGKQENLVRLWNPWGKGEWTGDWSDGSSLWQTLSTKDRDQCLSIADDGEFWMNLEDFCMFYTDLDICSTCPDFLDGKSSQWNTTVHEGRWVAGTTAGGCFNNRDSYWTNPQYRVKITGEYSGKDSDKNVLLSLMQKPDKRNRHMVENLHIGISVFEVAVAQTKTYMNAREVTEYFSLKPGEYLIVPSTFKSNDTASFLLTIITKSETQSYENYGHHNEEPVKTVEKTTNVQEDEKKKKFFRQNSDKYEEVDAEQLQKLLNEKILKGDLKSGGFSIDACRSMVALMDTSISGKLNGEEFVRLWKKVAAYKDIFFLTDVSLTGTLSMNELRNAFQASGMRMKDDMLSLMALRYGASSGQVTLENFISLILRLDCMYKIYKQLSDGKDMKLHESESSNAIAMGPPGVCMNIINARKLKDGVGTFANPEHFLKQDFEQLKQYCQIKRVRYIDEMFPPDTRSIGEGILTPSTLGQVQWLRPSETAAIGALTFQNTILEQVVPREQEFDDSYCGLFHFRFWRFGRWVDVVIDDKLPTINGQLIFVHSNDPTEFWPALLEKAYAKVCGSYADMNAGTPAEALVDFTGGVHMCIDLKDPPKGLWELMCRAGKANSLMGCGTPQGDTSANTVLPNGIVQGHAYTVTGVKTLMSNGQMVNLVRLWNPWGTGEWTSDWSDESPLWRTVSVEDREMCLKKRDDGEFWMPMEDFCRFYSDLDICCLCPEFLDENSSCHWKTAFYDGRWVAGTTAGGCMNNVESFSTNPQYRVTIDEMLSKCSTKQGERNMLVSLMQKPDKRNRRLVQNLHIGFSVFEYKEQRGKFPSSFFSRNRPVGQTKTYINGREVMEFMSLNPGEYLIVPSTFKPNETASFILTIISKSETHVHENSGGHDHAHENGEEHSKSENVEENAEENEKKATLFRQFSDKYEEVDAELLQDLLNERILKGVLKSGGFSIDACRSMVALMDTSVTGKLNGEEFIRLWKKVSMYKEIFSRSDVSQKGTLSLSELRNAIMATGNKMNDNVLNLSALRYGASSGNITLESFISVVLRFDSMNEIFDQLSNGTSLTLDKSEWLYLAMYT
ncbi:Calpain-1 catalytic subunit [Liparis tanakae]|uniref:Calpain-1 catalytic subunit n=1 Tax=Liparis tanakae TaxID=230148 RepID=A0A4Z2HVP4_9TELE|nr:Calpain-1 catalytic subunit [Liparis tanakae]